MRKILLLIILIIIFTFFSIFLFKRSNVETVFYENVNDYNIYILDISNLNINTNNIVNYFDDIRILEISPYINPIYKKVIKLNNYSFNTFLSNKKNISNFTSKYLNKLKDNALKEELIKYSLNGVKIVKVKIYTSNDIVNELISNYHFKKVKS